MRYITNYGLLFLILVLLFSFITCAQKPESTPAKAELSKEMEKPKAGEGWEVEWNQVQKEAKKEGKVILYTTRGEEQTRAIAQAIQEYGLALEAVSGRTGELEQKILLERRAGIYNVDFYISGMTGTIRTLKPAGALAPLEPLLILPEVKEPNMWYKGRLPFIDEEKTVFCFTAYLSGEIHVNTDMVRPGDLNTGQDLLSPRWKGKIIMFDPTIPGRANQVMGIFASRFGEDYLRQLAKQEPLLIRDARQQMDWVAKGRYAITIGGTPFVYREYKRSGAPVGEIFLKDVLYITAGAGYVSNMDKSPHPTASRVFVNWLLSKKGQILWDKLNESQSARTDAYTSAEYIKKIGRPVREAGLDYIDTTSEEWELVTKPGLDKPIIETFKSLLK